MGIAAILLCGGKGTRMIERGVHTHKPLLEVEDACNKIRSDETTRWTFLKPLLLYQMVEKKNIGLR